MITVPGHGTLYRPSSSLCQWGPDGWGRVSWGAFKKQKMEDAIYEWWLMVKYRLICKNTNCFLHSFFRLCMPVYAWSHYVYQCIRYIFIILYTILCVTILSEDHGPSNPTFTFGDGTCWFGRLICGTQLCKCWVVDMI